jgi:hypothetical protein
LKLPIPLAMDAADVPMISAISIFLQESALLERVF